jgi:GTP-binding protein
MYALRRVAQAACAAAAPSARASAAAAAPYSNRIWSNPNGVAYARAYRASSAAASDAAAAADAASEAHTGVRNFAIIAHVDHGKTTLLDTLMKQGEQKVATERLMDNNALEKERGITISSKYTSFPWQGVKDNVSDAKRTCPHDCPSAWMLKPTPVTRLVVECWYSRPSDEHVPHT